MSGSLFLAVPSPIPTSNGMFFYRLQDPHEHCLFLIPYNGGKSLGFIDCFSICLPVIGK